MLAFGAAPAAQSADPARDYTRAIDLYRQGQYLESVALVRTIGFPAIGEVVRDQADFDFKVKDTRRMEIAAVMLLDAAAGAFREKHFMSAVLNGLAGGVINKLVAMGAQSPAMRGWYLMEDALLEGARDFRTLRSQLEDARAQFPRDALLLMVSGSALETEGKDLDDAARFYRASLAISGSDGPDTSNGSSAECRLRLARVLYRLNDPAGSLKELDQLGPATDERIAYLAELFRAAAQGAFGRSANAEKKFVEALQWNAQAPYLGLAESMAARGNDAGARQVISKMLAARVEEEPWTAYLRGQWRYYPQRLDEARRAIK